MSKENQMNLSQRDFLSWLLKGGVILTLAGFILPAITYLLPLTRQAPVGGMVDVGKKEDFPTGAGRKVILGGKVILVIHLASGFRAFSATCTHLGCLVDWDEKKRQIACPCHAGFFNSDGSVISGPPPRRLMAYVITVVNGRVMLSA